MRRFSTAASACLLLACTVAAAADERAAAALSERNGGGDGGRQLKQEKKKAQGDATLSRFGAADATVDEKEERQKLRHDIRKERKKRMKKMKTRKPKQPNDSEGGSAGRFHRGSGKSGKEAASHAPTVAVTHAPTSTKSGKGTLRPTTTPSMHTTSSPTKRTKSSKGAKSTGAPTSPPITHFPTDVTPFPTPTDFMKPTGAPAKDPTKQPVVDPTMKPTPKPSPGPMGKPTPVPTKAPSAEPTPAPTPEPTTAATPPQLSCQDGGEVGSHIIDDSATLQYIVVPSNPPGANNGIFCARLDVENDGWIGLAVSLTGMMAGSIGMIGIPSSSEDGLSELSDEESVKKYDLYQGGVEEAPIERQTLRDTSIERRGDRTIMRFTKLLVEEGENPIHVEGANIFLHARGGSELGYHGPNRLSFELDFAAPDPTKAPSAEPTPNPTPPPTEDPTLKPTPPPSPSPTSEPTAKPTLPPTASPSKEPTSAPTEQSTESAMPTPCPVVYKAVQPTTLLPDDDDVDSTSGYQYGSSVDISDTMAIVGAPGLGVGLAGAAFVLGMVDGAWEQVGKLAPTSIAAAGCGTSVAVGDGRAIVGCPTTGVDGGKVYVYKREPGSDEFELEATLVPPPGGDPEGSSLGLFGHAVAINEKGLIAVGAYNENGGAGAVYLYAYSGANWVLVQTLAPDSQSDGRLFGFYVALDDAYTLVVGAPFGDGVVFIYKESEPNTWELFDRVEPPPSASGVESFGYRLAVDNTVVVASARGQNAVFVYDIPEGPFVGPSGEAVLTQTLPRNPGSIEGFGDAIALRDGRLVVTTPNAPSGGIGSARFYYQKNGEDWVQSQLLVSPAADYGKAVAVSKDALMVGAPDVGGTDSGSVVAYKWDETNDECDMDDKPTSQPTPAPTPEPTTAATPPQLSCEDGGELGTHIIDDSATLQYIVVPSNPPGANNGIFCARLDVENDGWIGLAVSLTGMMGGSIGMIGIPDEESVKKYDLYQGGVDEAPIERQTLRDTSIERRGDRTIMSFTKLLVEEGENPILVEGVNIFLHASGGSELGYHGQNRLSFELDFSASEPAPTTPPPTTPPPTTPPPTTPPPTTKPPTGSPSYSPTYWPTSNPTYYPSFYPTPSEDQMMP